MQLLSHVERSPLLQHVARIVLMEAHNIEEHLFRACGCGLVCGRSFAKEFGNKRVLGCVLFLGHSMRLVLKPSTTFVERWIVKRIVHHLVPDVLVEVATK